jgi:choline-sulfatase
MQGWRTRIAPDAEISDAYIEDRIDSEFARYTPPARAGKWSNQRELEEARVADGPYQQFDRRAFTATMDFINRYLEDPEYLRPGSHRPLLLKMSLLQPHYPFFTDQVLWDYYRDRVSIYAEEPCGHPVLSLSQQNRPVHVSEQVIRRATTAYYGMITTVDTYYGRVLSRLEELGQDLDDWIIIYTSDHGEMLGEHGIWEKTRFYEGSVRVPLIIRWPKRFPGGRIVNENVSLCDLYATLCDLAGIEVPPGLDSRSLAPLLEGTSAGWCNEAVSQMGREHVMIKQDDLKYQYYGEEIPEVLFDLARDPGERVNLAGDPSYADSMRHSRARLAELGHGPKADPDYRDAGY